MKELLQKYKTIAEQNGFKFIEELCIAYFGPLSITIDLPKALDEDSKIITTVSTQLLDKKSLDGLLGDVKGLNEYKLYLEDRGYNNGKFGNYDEGVEIKYEIKVKDQIKLEKVVKVFSREDFRSFMISWPGSRSKEWQKTYLEYK